ncbi:TetR family transcriptional regulator [Kitasatospora sp. MMS16-BH015]|uniref:TetR/AcrR family transcriptional regulator n=1 Tax=Kitasatospora sp. MMS16-BH015 TaxID=2018025 RepID=UPI000CA21CA8|nr:TetR/AcrR family transcriptional regulator [Kitasatospora sp. MMS16-BH015]AUG78786.1 TetR family transcriptional regulator [Kitasatospora sp. MMS16-BH015]
MPRLGLDTAAVVAAALSVVDERGPAALTLAAVADRTGVATPSLYKHVKGLADLRRRAAEQVRTELGAELREAVQGRSSGEAVSALLRAHQDYADREPHRYALLTAGEPGSCPGQVDQVDAVMAAALRGYELPEPELHHATHALRAVALASAALGGSAESRGLLVQLFTTGLRSL